MLEAIRTGAMLVISTMLVTIAFTLSDLRNEIAELDRQTPVPHVETFFSDQGKPCFYESNGLRIQTC